MAVSFDVCQEIGVKKQKYVLLMLENQKKALYLLIKCRLVFDFI